MKKRVMRLIEAARRHQMTPDEQEAQVRSFAFGNTHFENEAITKEDINRAAESLKSGRRRGREVTLYTDGKTPATDAEIEAEAGRIRKRRQKVERGGRKPVLAYDEQRDARIMLDRGESINVVAQYFGVSWSTIRRIKDAD